MSLEQLVLLLLDLNDDVALLLAGVLVALPVELELVVARQTLGDVQLYIEKKAKN